MHYLVYHLPSVTVELLSPQNLDARERAAYAARGESYLTMRSLLKRELARLTGQAAEEIRFTYGAHDKPELATQHFNISHSGEMYCMAFHHTEVGVDIEQMRTRQNLPALARRIMCAEQHAAWVSRGCMAEEFYDCWCAAEAVIKLYGASIWQAQQYPFLHRSGSICPLFDHAPSIELFSPAAGYRGAIAYHPTLSE